MISTIVGLIFLCVLLGFVVWGGQRLLALIPLGEPFATIIHVLLVLLLVIIVLYVLATLLGLVGIHVPYVGTTGLR